MDAELVKVCTLGIVELFTGDKQKEEILNRVRLIQLRRGD